MAYAISNSNQVYQTSLTLPPARTVSVAIKKTATIAFKILTSATLFIPLSVGVVVVFMHSERPLLAKIFLVFTAVYPLALGLKAIWGGGLPLSFEALIRSNNVNKIRAIRVEALSSNQLAKLAQSPAVAQLSPQQLTALLKNGNDADRATTLEHCSKDQCSTLADSWADTGKNSGDRSLGFSFARIRLPSHTLHRFFDALTDSQKAKFLKNMSASQFETLYSKVPTHRVVEDYLKTLSGATVAGIYSNWTGAVPRRQLLMALTKGQLSEFSGYSIESQLTKDLEIMPSDQRVGILNKLSPKFQFEILKRMNWLDFRELELTGVVTNWEKESLKLFFEWYCAQDTRIKILRLITTQQISQLGSKEAALFLELACLHEHVRQSGFRAPPVWKNRSEQLVQIPKKELFDFIRLNGLTPELFSLMPQEFLQELKIERLHFAQFLSFTMNSYFTSQCATDSNTWVKEVLKLQGGKERLRQLSSKQLDELFFMAYRDATLFKKVFDGDAKGYEEFLKRNGVSTAPPPPKQKKYTPPPPKYSWSPPPPPPQAKQTQQPPISTPPIMTRARAREILGLDPAVTDTNVIKKAFLKLAKLWHSDKSKDANAKERYVQAVVDEKIEAMKPKAVSSAQIDKWKQEVEAGTTETKIFKYFDDKFKQLTEARDFLLSP